MLQNVQNLISVLAKSHQCPHKCRNIIIVYEQVLMQTWPPIPKYSAADIANACKFKGPHDILSNCNYSPMLVDGVYFNNLESAYHYDKAQTSNRKDIADKLTICLRGIDAYRLGHSF